MDHHASNGYGDALDILRVVLEMQATVQRRKMILDSDKFDSEYCERQADLTRRQADGMTEPAEKKLMLRIAQEWQFLAQQRRSTQGIPRPEPEYLEARSSKCF